MRYRKGVGGGSSTAFSAANPLAGKHQLAMASAEAASAATTIMR